MSRRQIALLAEENAIPINLMRVSRTVTAMRRDLRQNDGVRAQRQPRHHHTLRFVPRTVDRDLGAVMDGQSLSSWPCGLDYRRPLHQVETYFSNMFEAR